MVHYLLFNLVRTIFVLRHFETVSSDKLWISKQNLMPLSDLEIFFIFFILRHIWSVPFFGPYQFLWLLRFGPYNFLVRTNLMSEIIWSVLVFIAFIFDPYQLWHLSFGRMNGTDQNKRQDKWYGPKLGTDQMCSSKQNWYEPKYGTDQKWYRPK